MVKETLTELFSLYATDILMNIIGNLANTSTLYRMPQLLFALPDIYRFVVKNARTGQLELELSFKIIFTIVNPEHLHSNSKQFFVVFINPYQRQVVYNSICSALD